MLTNSNEEEIARLVQENAELKTQLAAVKAENKLLKWQLAEQD